MIKTEIYTLKGTKSGELVLPKDLFEVEPNLNMLAQAVHVYEERSHDGLRKAQTRSEVNRTTKKLYKQKGTGGARHGSRRAPIFVGGGVALGPRPERRILSLPQALKNKARSYAFSLKAKNKEIVAIEGISKLTKTKEMGQFLEKLGKEMRATRFTVLLSEKSNIAAKYLRNIDNLKFVNFKNANAFDIWNAGLLILDEDVFKAKSDEEKVKNEKVVKKTTKRKETAK